MLDASLAVLSAALSAAEAAGPVNGRSQLVDPLSALADLHLKAKREDEAINCLKRAYTLDKAALGPDAAEVGEHLIGLGRAYHAQGKLEAAALTYEEARSVLSYALGPQHPSVLTVKEKIKGLSVIEVTPPRSRRRAARRAAARSRRGRRRARSSSTGWKSVLAEDAEEAAGDAQTGHRHHHHHNHHHHRHTTTATSPQVTQQTIDEKQDAADLRRHGLMSARGNRARDRFDHATYVAERVVSEQEKSPDSARKDALQKKKQLFREWIRRYNEQRLAAGEEEIERDSDDSGDGGDSRRTARRWWRRWRRRCSALGANISSQREAWPEVIDAATKMEQPMQKSSGLRRSTGAGILLRVLRQSLKTVGKDENRARSPLAVLMIVEWCVPVVDSSFRQALAGDRWVRRLVEPRGRTRRPTSLCAPPSASSSPTGRRGTAAASTRGRRCSRARGTLFPRGCGRKMALSRAGRRRRARRRRRGWCCWAPRRSTCRRG